MDNIEVIKRLNQYSKCSILINEEWTTNDFITLFKCFEYQYYLFFHLNECKLLFDKETNTQFAKFSHRGSFHYSHYLITDFEYSSFDPFNPFSKKRDQIISSYTNHTELKLKKVQYASPGSIDFLGIGEIFNTIKEFIFKYKPNEKEKIENDLLKINRMNSYVDLLRNLGYKENEIRSIVLKENISFDKIIELRNEKKIIDFKIEIENN